jgi:hypothetical protein
MPRVPRSSGGGPTSMSGSRKSWSISSRSRSWGSNEAAGSASGTLRPSIGRPLGGTATVRSVGTVVLTAIGVMRPSGLGPRVRLCITSLAAASPGRSAALAVSPAEDLPQSSCAPL